MEPLAVIGGTSLLQSSIFSGAEFKKIEIATKSGGVFMYERDDQKLYFVQRHECDSAREYCPPHLINFPAIAAALRMKGVSRVISFASVGSLNTETFLPGDIVIIDDHFCPFKSPSFYAPSSRDLPDTFREAEAAIQKKCHFIPNLKTPFREEVVASIRAVLPVLPKHDRQRKLIAHGVYANAQGPRFETKAEIKFYSQFADVVGMTGSLEVTVLQEQHIDVAVICMIDNWANGLENLSESLAELTTMTDFYLAVESNQSCVEEMARTVVNAFAPKDLE